MSATDSQEARFELAARVVWLESVADAEPEVFRPPQRDSELLLGKESAEVPERSDGLVTGMTARRDYLTGEEGRGPVHADALAAVSLARNGDVDIDAHSD